LFCHYINSRYFGDQFKFVLKFAQQ
jgi:hypothetical protein